MWSDADKLLLNATPKNLERALSSDVWKRQRQSFQVSSPVVVSRKRTALDLDLCAEGKAPVYKLLRADFEVFRPAGATRCTNWDFTLIGTTIRV